MGGNHWVPDLQGKKQKLGHFAKFLLKMEHCEEIKMWIKVYFKSLSQKMTERLTTGCEVAV